MAAETTSIWPHAEGLVRLAYALDGAVLFTGGSESYIRSFPLGSRASEEAGVIEFCEEGITSLACSRNYLCSTEEDGRVALYDLATEKHDFVKLITRCSLPARSARFDAKGNRIAVTSDELIVKVIDVQDPTKIQILAGHKKAVREATWCPDGSLLTTSDAEGTIRIWELNGTSEASCIKVLEGLIAADEPESYFGCEAVWHPSGKYFVVASRSHEIVIISRDSWSKIGTFSEEGHTSEISALCWSANGNYLASAGKDSQVLIWSTATRLVVSRMKLDKAGAVITGLQFQPFPSGSNILSFVDSTGQLTHWANAVPRELAGPSLMARAPRAIEEEDEEEEEEDVLELGSKLRKEARRSVDLGGDDWIDDDDGLAGGYDEPPRKLDKMEGGWNGNGGSYLAMRGQDPFQPGSTPLKDRKRYLAFNMLGVIHTVERDSQNIVEIDFHDRGLRTGSHFSDHFQFTIAALGEQGAVFGVAATDASPSQIFYKPSDEGWSPLRAWQYPLPAGESVTLLAISGLPPPTSSSSFSLVGTGTIMAATSQGYLRFLTGSGIQRYCWNLGVEIIAIAGGKDWALVISRDGNEGTGLEYLLVDTDTFEVVQSGRLPIAKGDKLTWCGFTDEDIPAIYTSAGLLSVLDRSRRPRQARWVPALDTSLLPLRAGKTESYWPIGVTESHLHVIILKGSDKFPGFPTPVNMEVDIKFPLMRTDAGQGELEEQYLRQTIFSSHFNDGLPPSASSSLLKKASERTLECDKSLLKLIQTSCKAENLTAALDLVLLLSLATSFEAAIKIAGFFQLPGLRERIEVAQEGKLGTYESGRGVEKREKWEHLVDDRIVVKAGGGGGGGRRGGGGGAPMSSLAPVTISRAGTGGSSPWSRKAIAAPPSSDAVDIDHEQEQVEGEEEEEEEEEEEQGMEVDPDEDDERLHIEEDLLEPGLSSPQQQIGTSPLPLPKKGANPFARRHPSIPGPHVVPSSSPIANHNPFSAAKKNGGATKLSSTGSFFGRVEAGPIITAAVGKGKGKKSAEGKGQSLLFDASTPNETTIKSVGKKRKSIAIEDEVVEDEEGGNKRETTGEKNSLLKFMNPAPATTSNGKASKVTKGNSSGFSKLAQFKLAKIATPTLLVSEPKTQEEQQVETQITEQEELTQLAFAEEGVE